MVISLSTAVLIGLAFNFSGSLILAVPNRIWRKYIPPWLPRSNRVIPNIDVVKEGRNQLFSEYTLEPIDPGFQEISQVLLESADSNETPDLIRLSQPGGYASHNDPWPKNGVAIGYSRDRDVEQDRYKYHCEKIGSQQYVSSLINRKITELEHDSDQVFLMLGGALLCTGFILQIGIELLPNTS